MTGTSNSGHYDPDATLVGKPFRVRILDSYGDGMCCSNGNGHYRVYMNGGLVKEGGQFGSEEQVLFTYEAASTPSPSPAAPSPSSTPAPPAPSPSSTPAPPAGQDIDLVGTYNDISISAPFHVEPAASRRLSTGTGTDMLSAVPAVGLAQAHSDSDARPHLPVSRSGSKGRAGATEERALLGPTAVTLSGEYNGLTISTTVYVSSSDSSGSRRLRGRVGGLGQA